MATIVTAASVLTHNRLSSTVTIGDDIINEAGYIINKKLGDDFVLAHLGTENTAFYYNAIRKQVMVLLLELPNSDYLFNTNARYEKAEELEQDKKELIDTLKTRIEYYISEIQEEMGEDGDDTEDDPDIVKAGGITFMCIGGNESLYPENDTTKYPD